MKGFIGNIEQDAIANNNFRKVIFTAQHCQLVLMHLKPGEEIGEEVHTLDQFFRIELGSGTAILEGEQFSITDGFAVIVPAGIKHNIINASADADLKLYTIYSPPEHKDAVVHPSKAKAQADTEDHFDGKTSF